MAIAMTVGATKILIFQESGFASIRDSKTVHLQPPREAVAASQGNCFTGTSK